MNAFSSKHLCLSAAMSVAGCPDQMRRIEDIRDLFRALNAHY